MNKIWYLCLAVMMVACSCSGAATVKKYGIVGDGETLTTEALQRAIDDCSAKGGGTLSLPAGRYLTGTLVMRGNVTLHLEEGAVIVGSRDIADYPALGRRKALIFAENVDNISITGKGEVNGSGAAFNWGNNAPNRPTLILFLDCKNVDVDGVKMADAGFWTFRFVRCDGVDITNVNVVGHVNWNNDGFDIESKNVTISDCTFDTDDDAICFKSEDPDFVVENITVSNCRVASNCNFIKFGTASAGGFRNVRVFDCSVVPCSRSVLRDWSDRVPGVTEPVTGIAGIALEVVDGGFMEDVVISRIDMQGVQTPVFIRLGRRRVSDNSYLKNVVIEDITATSVSHVASSITGVPGLRVDNVTIRNVDFKLKGGGKVADTQVEVPEAENLYPENRMFGVMLPAYGFYVRHADNISFENVTLSWEGDAEERHALWADDVNGMKITGSTIQAPAGSLPAVYHVNSKNIVADI